MNAFNLTLCSSASTLCSLRHQWRHHHLRTPTNTNLPTLEISSSSLRRRRNSKKNTKPLPSSDQRIEMVFDFEDVSNRVPLSLREFFSSYKSRFNGFVSSGVEAFTDLKTLITIDSDRRVIIACRRSSLHFLSNLILWGIVIVVSISAVMKLGFLGFQGGYDYGESYFRRRDRSLGGKEVVVGKRRFKEREGKKKDFNFRFPVNPLSPAQETSVSVRTNEVALSPSRKHASTGAKLPKWWVDSFPSYSASMTNNQELQEEAERLIRAIMDNRMSGKDITEDDIIQLRRMCKTSGARVFIETANARDSFYRTSVDFVLNSCSSSMSHSTIVMIDGEDPRQFLAGLADNVGLESIRAARIVSAAVAARTRSWFLQAWALEMQGKRSEAVMELSKICCIHQIFPPEESSAEMEMVARGLEKHLSIEQRELLWNLIVGICGGSAASRRSTAEALGLGASLDRNDELYTPINSVLLLFNLKSKVVREN